MRVGEYQLQVVHPDGTAFYEVCDSEGNFYVVAEPGETFLVRLTRLDSDPKLPRNANRKSASAQIPVHRATMKIDGKCVGIGQVFKHPNSTRTFEGFVKKGDESSITYETFVFAKPVVSNDASNHIKRAFSSDDEAGTIAVQVHQVIATGQSRSGSYTASADSLKTKAVQALPEGKKFFLAPSLTTATGKTTHAPNGFSKTYFTTDPAFPHCLALFKLRYETPSTLLLRRILSPANPAHASILNAYEETRMTEHVDTQGTTSTSVVQRTVKQEQHGQPQIINLTDLANENEKNGHWECDLTSEEAPRWRKKSRKTT